MLLIFGTTLLVLMSIFYGSYVPGGLFVPALLIGASYGRAFGLLLRTSVVFGDANLSLYALLGAGAVMSGMRKLSCVVREEYVDGGVRQWWWWWLIDAAFSVFGFRICSAAFRSFELLSNILPFACWLVLPNSSPPSPL